MATLDDTCSCLTADLDTERGNVCAAEATIASLQTDMEAAAEDSKRVIADMISVKADSDAMHAEYCATATAHVSSYIFSCLEHIQC